MRILDSDKKYMFPDVESMKTWFDEFNHRFFGRNLVPITFKTGSLEKRTHGIFIQGSSRPGFNPEQCEIILNEKIFTSEDKWRNTFLHEMVHYAVYKQTNGGNHGHDKEFKRIASRINKESRFKIETYIHGRVFRPRRKEVENWEKNRCRDFIIGRVSRHWKEDFVDEDTEEVINIERRSSIATFKTTKAYLPEIIDNLDGKWNEIEWFEVTACCQKLALIRPVNYTPDYREEYLCERPWFEGDIKNGRMINDGYGPVQEFGPIECRFLGTTVIQDGVISGYNPGSIRSSFRKQYFQNAEEIGTLAAEKLVALYQKSPQWYITKHHGTYDMKPTTGDFTIEVDSRFIALVAMTPKRIQINPVRSDLMMDFVQKGDCDSLAKEITRVIKSRQKT